MFTFADPSPTVIERKILCGDAMLKYPDKYMIVTNTCVEDAELYGDILAILTPTEYFQIVKPKPMTPKYQVWEGMELKSEGLGVVGFYL